MSGVRNRPLRAGLVALLVVVVTVASLTPATGGSTLPVGDKLLHLLGYATVAAGVAVVAGGTERRASVTFVGPTTLGGVIELLQWPLATRTADPMDAVANAAGAGLVASFVWLFDRRAAAD